jgi:predicted flap endonuclease-1-like 5' DNA nuclease
MGNYSMIPFSQDNLLVLVALGLVALLALLTIVGMIKGARLKSARRAAEKEEEARIKELRDDGVEKRDFDAACESFAEAPRSTPASTLAPEGQLTSDRRETPAAEPATTPPVAEPAVPRDEAAKEPTLADEPIAATAPLNAAPVNAAADMAAPPAGPDPAPGGGSITQLKGLGPKIATRLGELGITQVDQLAWLDDQEAADLDAQLGAFQGRMERDRWREQARFLAQGDRAGYEAQFGKLG